MKYFLLFIICLFSFRGQSQTSFNTDMYVTPAISSWHGQYTDGLSTRYPVSYGIRGNYEKSKFQISLGYEYYTSSEKIIVLNFENSNFNEAIAHYKRRIMAFPLSAQLKISDTKIKIYMGEEIVFGWNYKSIIEEQKDFGYNETRIFETQKLNVFRLGTFFNFRKNLGDKWHIGLTPKIRYPFFSSSLIAINIDWAAEVSVGHRFGIKSLKK